MNDQHTEILLGIQKELSTNTEATKNIQKDIASLNTKVAFTNGKVRLHTKILLIVGAVVATLLITNGNENVIKILKLFI